MLVLGALAAAPFWLLGLVILAFFLILGSLAYDREGVAWIVLLLVLGVFAITSFPDTEAFKAWVFSLDSWKEILKVVAIYLAIGLPVSVLKWYLYAGTRVEEIVVEWRKYVAAAQKRDADSRANFREDIEKGRRHQNAQYTNYDDEGKREDSRSSEMLGFLYWPLKPEVKPELVYRKVRVLAYVQEWIIWWPFTLLLIVLEDFIKEVIDKLSRLFEVIAQTRFDNALAKIDTTTSSTTSA